MAQAIRLAERGRFTADPNPNVGCVIVKEGKVVGQGWHQKAGEPHAEVHAIRAAGERARGSELYVTLEPCSHQGRTPPCADMIVSSGVKKVVVAMQDPNPLVAGQGIKRLQEAGIEVEVGIGALSASNLNRGFIKRMQTQQPFVTLKLACSLDGKTAMASGESQWITSSAARKEVHQLRAASSAILTGSGTAAADNPRMTARLPDVTRQPIRVVLDRELKLSPDLALFDQPGETWLFCAESARNNLLLKRAQKMFKVDEKAGLLDLDSVLTKLGQREINQLLVEAGSRLAGQFVKLGLVDELVVFMSPDVLGSSATSLMKLPGLDVLAERAQFEFKDVRQFGRDLKLTLVPK